MKRLPAYLLLLFTIYLPVKGQDVSVTAAFDTSRIYIGDQTGFSIIINQPSGIRLDLPYFTDTLVKNIEILNGPVVDSSALPDGKIRIIEKYLVTSFDSGLYQVYPVFAEIRDEKGLKRFYSDYSVLEVVRVKITPPDTIARIFDIIKPYRAPLTIGEILPWVLAALLAAVLIWFIIKFLKRFRKDKSEIPVPVNPDPAHIIAFRELEKLKEEQLWQKGETKKYYTRLTEILRRYLENRFGVCSLEMTTSETLEALVRTGFRKNESYSKLKSVLNGADLVKFAKYKPEPSENELNFDDSWDFVLSTKKEEQADINGDNKEKVKEEGL